ncbi:conserved Plasmodium protein, unknown function [Plasmodium vivax]|nr:conserved Plasmodium protein, unknown function [Plasmodium vivax]
MRQRREADSRGGSSPSPGRPPRREKMAPLKNLKNTLLDADVLIDVSKIRIYAKENFDLELINNVNDRFVEKTYNLLVDTREKMIPEDELHDFIFLLMNERKENSHLERRSRKGHGKRDSAGGSAKCPIKNEVTNLIKKMNKFHFYFKEFLRKDKLRMDAADRGDGRASTWGTTRGTTNDNRGARSQSALQPNGGNTCRKDGIRASYTQRKGESPHSQSRQRKEQREKTERAIRSLLRSGLSETELDVAEEMHATSGGPERATKVAPFSQRVRLHNASPPSSDDDKVREGEDGQPYRSDYVEGGCTFQRGCPSLGAGRSTHTRRRHKQGVGQLGGLPHGGSDGSDSSDGSDCRPSEAMRRSQSDGAKCHLHKKNPFEDHRRERSHGATLTEHHRYRSRKKKKKKRKKKKNHNKGEGNQRRESLIFLKAPNGLTCEWKKHRGRDDRRKALGRNNVDNYLGDAYNSCAHPGEGNPLLGGSYGEEFSRACLQVESNNLVHTVVGAKEGKGYTKGYAMGPIKGHAVGTLTPGKKGLTPPSATVSTIPQEDYSKKGTLIKRGNNPPPEGEKRSDQLSPHDGEGQLPELHKRGRDGIHLKVPNGPSHLAQSDRGSGIMSVSRGGSPLPSGTSTSAFSNGNRVRRKGPCGKFHADGGKAKVNDKWLASPSEEVDTGEDEVKKGDRKVGLKANISIEKGKRKNGKVRLPLCEQTGGSIKGSADGSLVFGGAPDQCDDTASHFDGERKDDPNERNSDVATEEGVNTLGESNRGNRNYTWGALDLRPPQDDGPTVREQSTNEWEPFQRIESTLLHHKGEVAPYVRSEENYHVRDKNVKKYEQVRSNCTSSMEYPRERDIYSHRDVAFPSVSKNGGSSYSDRERGGLPHCASTLGGDNSDGYYYSGERFEEADMDEGGRKAHPRGGEKSPFLEKDTWKGPSDVGMNHKERGNTWRRNQGNIGGTHLRGDKKDTLDKRSRGFLPKGAIQEGGRSNYSKSPTYDRALIRHIERDVAFYEDISRDMEGVPGGAPNGSLYGPSEGYLHGPDYSPDCSPGGDSATSFNQKDFLLLKKKREEDSRLNKWINKINARENEKKKKIQEKKKESIKKELVDCTFHPRVSITQPSRVKSFIKEEGRKGGGGNIHRERCIKLGPHNGKGQFDEERHVAARGEDRRAARAKAITRVGSGWTDIAYDERGMSSMSRYEDALMSDHVVGRSSGSIRVGDPHVGVAAGGVASMRGYHTRGRYTEGEIPLEEDIHMDHRKSDGRSSGEEEPYRETKMKHRNRNELLYWKAMKLKEQLQRKKDAFEEAKENKFKSECKFSPEIKDNVKIFLSDLPKGYSKTVERIKRGVEEKRRVHNFLEFRIPVDTNGDKNSQNAFRSKWQGGKTTTLSPFSFDKGFYKVKIKPVYFETKIRLSENKIASLAIREDEDPLYIVDIFCKIHAIRDEDKRVLYEYVMDELGKASQGS